MGCRLGAGLAQGAVLRLLRHAPRRQGARPRQGFQWGVGWEPGARHPGAIMLKELSYRCSDTRHAAKARAPGKGFGRV